MVSEVKYDGVDQPDQGTVYFPMTRRHVPLPDRAQRRRSVEPRAVGAAGGARAGAGGAAVERRDRRQTWSISRCVRPQSLSMLVASFAGVALLLSVIGIYGVMGYYVQQHMKEISIRMALGGSRGDVAKLVVGQGMMVVIGGVIAGTALAFAATRLMSSLLFGVGATDPRAFTGVAALMVTVALLACAVPAWRAMRVQPAAVLRNE